MIVILRADAVKYNIICAETINGDTRNLNSFTEPTDSCGIKDYTGVSSL